MDSTQELPKLFHEIAFDRKNSRVFWWEAVAVAVVGAVGFYSSGIDKYVQFLLIILTMAFCSGVLSDGFLYFRKIRTFRPVGFGVIIGCLSLNLVLFSVYEEGLLLIYVCWAIPASVAVALVVYGVVVNRA